MMPVTALRRISHAFRLGTLGKRDVEKIKPKSDTIMRELDVDSRLLLTISVALLFLNMSLLFPGRNEAIGYVRL